MSQRFWIGRTDRTRAGFTLIELLVVVAIIAVLLALLTPALDKAIYQAELAVCGTHLHGIAESALAYALGNRRRYPERPIVQANANMQIDQLSTNETNRDDRPAMKKALGSLNGLLNDPLSGKVDIDGSPNVTLYFVYIPYSVGFGFRYKGEPNGLFKLGDRFSWQGTGYDVLASDFDIAEGNGLGIGSHPDKDGVWINQVLDNQPNPFNAGGAGQAGAAARATISWWIGNSPRGLVDLNYAFQDGSVRRYSDVKWNDPAFEEVPAFADPTFGPARVNHMPKH